MTKEEKELLTKDLCARLLYGVMIEITSDGGGILEVSYDIRLDAGLLADLLHSEDDFKPYLRPMSSITHEEKAYNMYYTARIRDSVYGSISEYIDWLNAHHFDYRGLVEKGLALEAPEDMYKH